MSSKNRTIATEEAKTVAPHHLIADEQDISAQDKSITLEQVGTGQIGTCFRVRLADSDTVLVKLPPPDTSQDPRRRATTPRATDREVEVLRLIAAGHSNRDIAAALNISVKTVEVHKANAMRKLALKGRTDVVRYAVINGWLDEP